MRLAESEEASIELDMNSGGGSVTAGVGAISEYARYPYEKKINVHGGAGSFAAFMLLWSDHNTATDMSQFLLHRAATPFKTEAAIKMVSDLNDKIRAKFEEKVNISAFESISGITVDRFFDIEQERVDVAMTSVEAREIGLIHEINSLTSDQAQAYNDMLVEANANIGSGFIIDKDLLNKDNSNSNFKTINMEKQFTQADIDAAVNKSMTANREAEQKRVSSWNEFAHIDAKKVLDGISSGKNISTDDIKHFATIEAQAEALKKLEDQNHDPAPVGDEAIPSIDAQAKELADFEADVMARLSL